MEINLLILSAGTRNKVVQYFKKELAGKGRVYATDCSSLAPALYEADEAILVPRITEPGYLDQILSICREKRITGVLSLILAVGTTPVISPLDAVETSFDKYRMYQKLCELQIPTGRCFMDEAAFEEALHAGEVKLPVFVKPAKGSASIGISRADTLEAVRFLSGCQEDMMIQEYMDGAEYGADVYVDMITKKVTSIFVKEKLKMRAGETDKSVSVKDEKLFSLIKNFVETVGFCGIIDIDIFRRGDEYCISEVNPRFGGGYPHAYECGVNVPAQIIRNLEGKANEEKIGAYEEGICMMKYNEIMIRRQPEEG